MEREILNNGISYFMGPLLNWTLGGVIRALVAEQHLSGFVAFEGALRAGFVAESDSSTQEHAPF